MLHVSKKKTMMSIILSVINDVKMYMYIDCVYLCVCVCVWIGDYRSPTGDDYMCMYSYTCRYKIKKMFRNCLFNIYTVSFRLNAV